MLERIWRGLEIVSGEDLLTRLDVRSFDNLIMKAIDDVLKMVLGEVSAEIILQHLKKSDLLKWMVFSDALRKIFGSGALLLENLILRSLYSKVKLKFEEKEGYLFSDYIKELKEKCRC